MGGNTSHRAGRRRKELYQVLRSQEFHVVAPDYRGYADSSSHVAPTETGVVVDARAVYDWVAARTKGQLIVWGHSRFLSPGCKPLPTGSTTVCSRPGGSLQQHL